MKVEKLNLKGLVLITPKVFPDKRGYFLEVFTETAYRNLLGVDFVQDNLSYSKYGTIRGLHFQREPHSQDKLVRCVKGRILDVVVDIKADSPTFGHHISVILSDEEHQQLFVPVGYAHGFSVLSNEAIVEYKCSEYYYPSHDGGIFFNDPELNIDWMVPVGKEIVSDKDKSLPHLKALL